MADRPGTGELIGAGAFALHCRGDVRLYFGDADCTPKSKKSRALLAILAAEQRPLSRLKIIDLLWSDRQEEQARASLRTLLADLKEQFKSHFDDLLVVDRERVALSPGVRTDLNDPSIVRPAGELFEGLDHIDPELDEWLRVERVKWAAKTAHPPACRDAGDVHLARHRPRTGHAVFGITLTLIVAVAVWLTASAPSLRPKSVQAKIDAAKALLVRSSPAKAEQARRMLVDVVEENPNDATALAALAEATMAASDHPGIGGTLPLASARREALAYSSRAVRLNPLDAAAWAALGFSNFATAAAVKPLEKAVELDPNQANYRWQLARALEYQNRYDEAYLHARRAIELDPRGPEPVIGLIRAASQLGRVQEMNAEVTAYAQRNPARDNLAMVKGNLAYHLNDDAACIRHLEPVVRKGNYRPLDVLISCLTALGEKRRAVELSAALRSFRLDVLREDAAAVERRAKIMGREFWLRNFESLAAADLLVKSGRAQVLVASFDASYDSVAEFEREGGRVALEPISILLAMQLVGRVKEARELRDLLAAQVRDQRAGMALDTWSLLAKAAVALADGDRDRSVDLLEQCFPDCFVGYLDTDISQSAFYGRLKGHPDFDQLTQRYRQRVNLRRKQAGLPPLRV